MTRHDYCLFSICGQLFEIDEWRSFGRAVRNSTIFNELHLFRVGNGANAIIGELLATSEQCIGAFFAEVKHNKSISCAEIELTGLSMDDLSEFILNNYMLGYLCLRSKEQVLLEQSAVLSAANSNVPLGSVDIDYCRFENDGSFEQMLEGCARLDNLSVRCEHI